MKLAFFLLLVAALPGCTATKPTASTPVQRQPAKFDYSPPSRQSAGSSNLTVALIRPRFVGTNPEYFVPPFNEMASSMAGDFEELLTAKGFTIRGPFGSWDEMVYNDKVSSNFALEVSIDLNPQYNRKYTSSVNWGSVLSTQNSSNYHMTGDVTLAGTLLITASSPKYGEKIWKKSIALDRQVFSYVGKLKWNGVPTIAEELNQDNEVYNVITRELEKYYAQAMNLVWQQIDVAEMRTVADQSKKADIKSN